MLAGFRLSLALLAGATLILGCPEKPGHATIDFRHRSPNPTQGKPVATFGGDSIGEGELKQRFSEMSPFGRARYQTMEQKKEYLDGLVRFELLAAEAVRRGLANESEVVETTKKVLVQQLLKKELDENAPAIAERDVLAYYEQRKGDYVKPAMTRLSVISFLPANKAKAESLLKDALKLAPLDYAGFGKLARENSEDPRTKALDGDTRYLSDEDLSAQFGANIIAAQAELKQVGEVLPRLVENEKGAHIIKLQGRQIALNLTVEQAKSSITSVLQNERREARFQKLLEALKQQANYRVEDAVLATIEVDPKAPTAPSKGPTPGFIAAPAVRADK